MLMYYTHYKLQTKKPKHKGEFTMMRSNNPLATISYLGPRRHVTQVIVAEESIEGGLLWVADNLSKVIFSIFIIQIQVYKTKNCQ
jgi:hypothetical protein